MKFKEIILKSKDLCSLEKNLHKEWLITNGIGGYASSTVLGINTRKYHGLLISALYPPGSRTVHLEKIDEDIIIGNQTYRFGANEFKDTIYPKGFMSLKEFSICPLCKRFRMRLLLTVVPSMITGGMMCTRNLFVLARL